MVEKKLAPFILIGCPTYSEKFDGNKKSGGGISFEWASRFFGIQTPLGSIVSRYPVYDKIIDVARNDIVEYGLNIGVEWFFFVADDVFVPGDAIMKMMAHQKEIVTGVYWTKENPPYPYIWRGLDGPYIDWKMGELFEIDLAGCDCLLVHNSVFRKIDYPYFSRDWSWFKDKYGNVTRPPAINTEDFWFYAKAKEAGFKVWCDSSVLCEHQDRRTGKKYGLMPGMPQYENKQVLDVSDDKLVAVLGAGNDKYEYVGGKHIMIDENEKFAPDLRSSLKAIPVKDNNYDVVYAPNVLQRYSRDELTDCINEWTRILKVGGELLITVPSAEYAFNRIASGGFDGFDMLYGWNQEHKNAFTKRLLEEIFATSTLLKDVKVTPHKTLLKVTGIKEKHHETPCLHDMMQGKYVEQTKNT